MPTFDTPASVRVVLSLAFGEVRIIATARADTTVEAYPRDAKDQMDVWTAEQLRINYADGRLLVNTPESDSNGGAVVVVITVPTGSSLHGRAMAADFLGVGQLGDCRLSTGLGRISLDRTGSLQLTAALGDITVNSAAGSVEATTERGDVRLGHVEGRATISSTSEGDAVLGEVHGVARLHAEKGDVRIQWAHAGVEARTSQGDVDIGKAVRGSVVADTTFGNIRIGVAEASGARLVLDSTAGTVYTSLSLLNTDESVDEVVHVHARTVIGDIVVERADCGTK
ncbi:Putative adhesin [Streptomyces sp. Ncost-T6T-1]|uniref:DUF4097 family beta strand repeat-containing protein n=1 Tax=Streptomyces sp. Ncost-T6T-1 TaxID=1100828 RepID=UPI000805D005|nr:DUF4097 family beta strand repeat-containing protein [Streptomyces sp. Ncost-T6T-1]SBU97337.1 Putative adhesin [Streptomyces sp. Ncost-T6T-1]